MYEEGSVSMMNVLLRSQDMGDFLNHAYYVSTISEYDRKMLVEYQKITEKVKKKKAELASQKKKLEKLRDAIIAGKLGNSPREVNRFIKAVMAYDYSWAHQFLDTSLALESKAPKKKFQALIVDAFHFSDAEKMYMDLIKKYPSKQCNCLYHDKPLP